MQISFEELYWIIILFLGVSLLTLWSIIKYKANNTFKVLLGYALIGWVLIFLYIFKQGKSLFNSLVFKYNIQAVLRDPQQILDVLFSFSFWIAFFYSIFFIAFILNLYITSILRKTESVYLSYVFFIFFYFFIFLNFISWKDLLTFHIEVFSQDQNFQYEPDIEKWYYYTELELYDLLLYLFFLCCFYSINFYKDFFIKIEAIHILRIIILLLFMIFSIFFICGESLIRDLILLFVTFIFSEIYIFSMLFFYNMKKNKN